MGTNTTFEHYANEDGIFVTLMFVFRGTKLVSQLDIGAPEGGLIEVADHRYLTSELFFKWLQHFINFAKPRVDKKEILLFESLTTHTKNLKATIHRFRPFDMTLFVPLQK